MSFELIAPGTSADAENGKKRRVEGYWANLETAIKKNEFNEDEFNEDELAVKDNCLEDVNPDEEEDIANCELYENLSYSGSLSRLALSIQRALNNNGNGYESFFTPFSRIRMKNIRALTRNSVSNSFVVEAFVSIANCVHFQDVRVIMKFSQMKGALKSEKDIYSCFVHDFKVPFFAYPYAVTQQDRVTQFGTLRTLKEEVYGNSVDAVGYVMTEHCGSVTLADYVKRSRYRDANFYSAILQCIFALRYLRERGVEHGDLHLNNIMFPTYREIRQGKEEALYMDTKTGDTGHDPKSFKKSIKLHRILKIFDWDHARTGVANNNYNDLIQFWRGITAGKYSPTLDKDFQEFKKAHSTEFSGNLESRQFEELLQRFCVDKCTLFAASALRDGDPK